MYVCMYIKRLESQFTIFFHSRSYFEIRTWLEQRLMADKGCFVVQQAFDLFEKFKIGVMKNNHCNFLRGEEYVKENV